MQAGRAVLVDHERVAGARLIARRRLRRPLGTERSAADVFEQGRVLRRKRDLIRGLGLDARRGGPGERAPNGVVLLHLDTERSERCRQVGPGPVADARPQVADLREALPHVVDPEVLRLESADADLVPGERGRDRRARLGPQRIRRRDVRPLPVHVVVDEDLPGAVGDPPGHRHLVGVRLLDQPPARPNERARLRVRVRALLQRDIDLQAGGPARLREPRHAELLEQDLDVPGHVQHVVVRVRRERVQIEEQVVGVLDILTSRVKRVHLDRPEVRDEQERGEVVDGQVVDPPRLRVFRQDGASMDPVRRVGRRRLLVEVGAADPVGHPLHRERPPLEVRQQQVRDVEVVRDQIALRVALVGPEDLVEVGEPELPLGQLDPPCVALAFAGLERTRELNCEGGTARTARSLRHANDGNRGRPDASADGDPPLKGSADRPIPVG